MFITFSVCRSGTEEEYNQLHQLLGDIYKFRQDIQEQRGKDKEEKKKKEREEKTKGEEMRATALSGMASTFTPQDP